MRSLAVTIGESGDCRPHILDSNREQQPLRVHRFSAGEQQAIAIVVDFFRCLHGVVNESRAKLLRVAG